MWVSRLDVEELKARALQRHLSIYLSMYLSIYPAIYLSIYIYIYIHIYLYIYLSIYIYRERERERENLADGAQRHGYLIVVRQVEDVRHLLGGWGLGLSDGGVPGRVLLAD